MELTITERFALMRILPAQDDVMTMKALRKLRHALAIDEVEAKKLGIRLKNDHYEWKEDVAVDIEVGELAASIVTKTLKTLEDQKQISDELIDLYDKFVGGAS